MEQRKQSTWRFWPFGPGWALLTSAVVVAVLVTGFFLLREFADWPGEDLEPGVLIAIVVISSVPVLLMLLEAVAAGGGSLAGFGFNLSFGAVADAAAEQAPPSDVPRNMGASEGLALLDSAGTQVVEAINEFARHDVAVIDLEDGTAWWDTRLAVICAGATRLGSPRAIAFVATEAGRPRTYQGWAEPEVMLKTLALSNRPLRQAIDRAAVATARWSQHFQPPPATRGADGPDPTPPPYPDLAFTGSARRPDAPEQILLHEVRTVESAPGPKMITIVGLHDLFGAFLHKEALDDVMPQEQWLRTVFCSEADYLAVTRCGRYVGLIARAKLLTDVIRHRLFPDLACEDCSAAAERPPGPQAPSTGSPQSS
ncbi:hypothetical protein [Streptomyces sp. KS_5]|uniref:hypothetical protein n=1 Tax=Streptomyces TaxID=1883 RepID=UPI000897E6A8|nr:hypothetical protein [Streptomyces sp. KS_5]SEE68934.1 hypothetical protein SAMN05428938_8104 [Streptomyces sp. KS_5]